MSVVTDSSPVTTVVPPFRLQLSSPTLHLLTSRFENKRAREKIKHCQLLTLGSLGKSLGTSQAKRISAKLSATPVTETIKVQCAAVVEMTSELLDSKWRTTTVNDGWLVLLFRLLQAWIGHRLALTARLRQKVKEQTRICFVSTVVPKLGALFESKKVNKMWFSVNFSLLKCWHRYYYHLELLRG